MHSVRAQSWQDPRTLPGYTGPGSAHYKEPEAELRSMKDVECPEYLSRLNLEDDKSKGFWGSVGFLGYGRMDSTTADSCNDPAAQGHLRDLKGKTAQDFEALLTAKDSPMNLEGVDPQHINKCLDARDAKRVGPGKNTAYKRLTDDERKRIISDWYWGMGALRESTKGTLERVAQIDNMLGKGKDEFMQFKGMDNLEKSKLLGSKEWLHKLQDKDLCARSQKGPSGKTVAFENEISKIIIGAANLRSVHERRREIQRKWGTASHASQRSAALKKNDEEEAFIYSQYPSLADPQWNKYHDLDQPFPINIEKNEGGQLAIVQDDRYKEMTSKIGSELEKNLNDKRRALVNSVNRFAHAGGCINGSYDDSFFTGDCKEAIKTISDLEPLPTEKWFAKKKSENETNKDRLFLDKHLSYANCRYAYRASKEEHASNAMNATLLAAGGAEMGVLKIIGAGASALTLGAEGASISANAARGLNMLRAGVVALQTANVAVSVPQIVTACNDDFNTTVKGLKLPLEGNPRCGPSMAKEVEAETSYHSCLTAGLLGAVGIVGGAAGIKSVIAAGTVSATTRLTKAGIEEAHVKELINNLAQAGAEGAKNKSTVMNVLSETTAAQRANRFVDSIAGLKPEDIAKINTNSELRTQVAENFKIYDEMFKGKLDPKLFAKHLELFTENGHPEPLEGLNTALKEAAMRAKANPSRAMKDHLQDYLKDLGFSETETKSMVGCAAAVMKSAL